MAYPKTVTGGCLCTGIRFTINFTANHDWVHGPHTCQCTQCRKASGSLLLHYHTVSATELTFTSTTTLTSYTSSPQHSRLFCNKCGSTIGWKADYDNGDVELCVGTLDEECLIGKNDDGDGRRKGPEEVYRHSLKGEGFGKVLASVEGDHFYYQNFIPEVTSLTSGSLFLEGSKGGPLKKE